jgi:hypothetical protein
MDFDAANEADVREEIAAPLLAGLGYRRGTANNIRREVPLKLRMFLGRKKSSDKILRGVADYILYVTGIWRWVLETKAPNIAIGIDAIEQAVTYARHPEVSGSYAAILNGRRFVLMRNSQSSNEPPILDIEVISVENLIRQLESTLSPAALRRDLRPIIIDTNRPIADGYRSRVDILKGSITSSEAKAYCSPEMPQMMQALGLHCAAFRARLTN